MKRLAGFLVRHWSNMLLSLVLAVMIWVVAEVRGDPNLSQPYPYPVVLEVIGKDPNLIMTSELPTGVRVQIRAPQSVWSRLIAERGVRAYIDLSGLGPGTYSIPIQIRVNAQPVLIEDYEPREVEVVLEERMSKTFPVEIEIQGEPAVGYQFGDLKVNPDKVRVEGPRSAVERVKTVRARLFVQDLRATLERVMEVRAYDERGLPVEEVTVTPNQVQVTLPVKQLGGYRDVSVRVVLEGQPATGYLIANIAVYPPVVTLFSPNPTKVLEIPGFVETEPVNIEGVTEDVELRVGLKLPEDIQVVGEDKVLVQIAVQPVKTSVTVQLPVEVVGLSPNHRATVSPSTVDVILLGPVVVLKNFKPEESMRAYVDVTDLEPGTHTLEVRVEVFLKDVEVKAILPPQVEVTIEVGTPLPATPTGTATPSTP